MGFTRKRLFFIALLIFGFSNYAVAKVIRVSPNDDLLSISKNADSGDVLVLGPHQYDGQIHVIGKKLTIIGAKRGRTRLSNNGFEALILVKNGGSVDVIRVDMSVPSSTQYAIRSVKSKVKVSHCSVRGINSQLLNMEASELKVSDCKFESIRSQAIHGTNGSKIQIVKSLFRKISQRAIVLEKSSEVSIKNSIFKDINTSAVLAVNNSKVEVFNTRFQRVRESVLHVDGGGRLHVENSHIEDVSDYALVGNKGVTLSVHKTEFNRVNQIAIVGKQLNSVSVTDSDFSNVGQAIYANDNKSDVKISGNTINSSAGAYDTVIVKSGRSVVIQKNLFLNMKNGVRIEGTVTAPGEVSDNNFYKIKSHGLYVAAKPSGSVSFKIANNRFVSTGSPSIMFDSDLDIALVDNIVLSEASHGLYVQQGASVKMKNNFIHANNKSIYLHSSAGTDSKFEGGNILTKGMYRSPVHKHLNPDPVVNKALSNPIQMQTFNDAYTKIVALVNSLQQPKQLKPLQSHLDKHYAALNGLRGATSGFARIRLTAKDAIGRFYTPEFSLLDVSGRRISSHNNDKPTAVVAPGTYYVKVRTGQDKPIKVEANADQVADLKVDTPNHLVVNLIARDGRGNWRKSQTALPLRPVDQRAKALKYSISRRMTSRQFGATDADVQKALTQARQVLPELHKQYGAVLAKGGKKAALATWKPALNWAYHILAVAGDAKDADRLVSQIKQDKQMRFKRLVVAAYIEKRLGILDQGAIKAALNMQDPLARIYAAALLRFHGNSEGDSALFDALKFPSNNLRTTVSVRALMDTNTPQTVEAMKMVIQAFLTEKKRLDAKPGSNAKYPRHLWRAAVNASLYLVANGKPEDMAVMNDMVYAPRHFSRITKLVSDPRPLLDFALGFRGPIKSNYNPAWAVGLCMSMRSLPQQEAHRYINYFESALVKANALGAMRSGKKINPLKMRSEFNVAISRCRPNSTTARLVYKQDKKYISEADWIPKTWLFQKQVEKFITGDAKIYHQLQHFEPSRVANAVSQLALGSKVKYPSLFVNYVRTVSRECGIRHCSFALDHHQSPKGALLGMVHIKPQVDKKAVSLQLEFDLAAYPHRLLGAYEMKTSRKKRGFTRIDPARLVEAIYIQQDNKRIKLKLNSRGGKRVYRGVLSQPSLNNTYIYIKVKFYTERKTLAFPLFVNS